MPSERTVQCVTTSTRVSGSNSGSRSKVKSVTMSWSHLARSNSRLDICVIVSVLCVFLMLPSGTFAQQSAGKTFIFYFSECFIFIKFTPYKYCFSRKFLFYTTIVVSITRLSDHLYWRSVRQRRHLGQSEDRICCVSLVTRTCTVWRNVFFFLYISRSVGRHFKCSVDTLILILIRP